MTKEETLQVINEIIDESTKAMKAEAKQLLDAQEWDFNTFNDRNTFARTAMEAIFDKEKKQYQKKMTMLHGLHFKKQNN